MSAKPLGSKASSIEFNGTGFQITWKRITARGIQSALKMTVEKYMHTGSSSKNERDLCFSWSQAQTACFQAMKDGASLRFQTVFKGITDPVGVAWH